MGTSSPCLKSWTNRNFICSKGKRHTIDAFGNSITSATLPGDHWRSRHDTVKNTIFHLATWATVQISCEVLYIFSPYISAYTTLQSDKLKQVQGVVPDFFFNRTCTLGDVKTITCCQGHYPNARFRHGIRNDAVRIRQNKVTAEYRGKANKADRQYNNHQESGTGPVATKLASFGKVKGLVCGAFGEGSPDMHKLIANIVETAAIKRYQDMGARTSKDAIARANRFAYKTLGVEMMRSTSLLRVGRLGIVLAKPENQKATARRRSHSAPAWFETRQEYFDKHSFSTSSHERAW